MSAGAVELVSAQTGAVVRTLVPAGGGAGSDTATGGRDFAVVGPSGRYVYFTDIAGAARVPLTGGAVQRLPTPPGHGSVASVFADRSDTRFEETVGSADDSQPLEVYAARLGSSALTDLGPGTATGWNAAGMTAYLTTTAVTTAATSTQVAALGVTITGVPLAKASTGGFREMMPSRAPGDDGACGPASRATAIGPSGQIVWVLGGCSSASAGQLTYAFRVGEHYSLVEASFPADDQGFFRRVAAVHPGRHGRGAADPSRLHRPRPGGGRPRQQRPRCRFAQQ